MCPDPQLLSIYMDGELPSPWKEKMETHLAECSACKERYKNFRNLQEMFKKKTRQSRTYVESDGELRPSAPDQTLPEQEFIESAKEKVWRKMESRRRYSHRSVWNYRLSLPLPAAAAAAAVILAILAVLYIRGGNLRPQDSAVRSNFIFASEEEEMPSIIPAAQDMNGLLQLLGSDGTDVLILRLPESRNFARSGEPAIIRAADYSRRQP
jgi:anti-sigma factor RsiW